jgi:hypothetical protein
MHSRKFAAAAMIAAMTALSACGSDNAANNTMTVENLEVGNVITENDMNAVDMNAVDLNATDMNAVDMNAGNTAAPPPGNSD